jgi:hypothetical protein
MGRNLLGWPAEAPDELRGAGQFRRLRGEDRLVLSGVLVEIDARHGAVLRMTGDGYTNKNNKLLPRYRRN